MDPRNRLDALMEREIDDPVGNQTPTIHQQATLLTGLILSLSTQQYPSIKIRILNSLCVPIKFDTGKSVLFLLLVMDSFFMTQNPEMYRA
jgi:hypothetical protein